VSKVSPLKKEWKEIGKGEGGPIRLQLHQVLTPIFDEEIGYRMSIARMRMRMDQAELGRLLGVSQQVISKLEQGKIRVPERPFNYARFHAIFGAMTSYILSGAGREKYETGNVKHEYWKHKLKRKTDGKLD
jgi:transcriptional regulator with XRE-family HTH domain